MSFITPEIKIRPPKIANARKDDFCDERYFPVSFDLNRKRYFFRVPSIISLMSGYRLSYFFETKKSATK